VLLFFYKNQAKPRYEIVDNIKQKTLYQSFSALKPPSTQITRFGQGTSGEKFLGIIFAKVNSSEDPSPVKQNIRGVNIEKFLGIFPRIGWNFSMNMSEHFLGIIPKLIPRNINSKTQIFLRKSSELYLLWKFY
jgi:hypothetical protein